MNIKDNAYILDLVTWEITFACNMRCMHCGSGCGSPKPDELTTEEALCLCDQLIDMGVKQVCFSGGEPFIRKDWPVLARRLCSNGVIVDVISNGWFIDEKIINTAFAVGLSNIAVSLDGCEKTHDDIRVKGSFRRVIKALKLMQEMEMTSVVCTTLNSRNIKDLAYLKQILIETGVERWQLQLTDPMGNAIDHKELFVAPSDLTEILDFAHEVMKEGRIVVDIADNLGYFDVKSTDIKRNSPEAPMNEGIWEGCQAGETLIGIRCNGDVTGCLSIRDDDFIEGNIRNISLHEIWTRPGAFAWNRNMSRENLTGFCRECRFGDLCLGGCTPAKRTTRNALYENKYCFYRAEFLKECEIIDELYELDDLISKGHELFEACQYEAAEKCLSKALKIDSFCIEALDRLAFINYELKKYDDCIQFYKRSLEIDSNSAFVHKGLGSVLTKVGKLEEGIAMFRKVGKLEEGIAAFRWAIELCDESFMEPYYDLAVVLSNNSLIEEALAVLDEGRSKSDEFKARSEELYQNLLKE